MKQKITYTLEQIRNWVSMELNNHGRIDLMLDVSHNDIMRANNNILKIVNTMKDGEYYKIETLTSICIFQYKPGTIEFPTHCIIQHYKALELVYNRASRSFNGPITIRRFRHYQINYDDVHTLKQVTKELYDYIVS